MDEVRYGVIGTGMMGIEHIENIGALDGGVVTALADPEPSSLEAGRAAAGHDLATFADHRELLDSGLADAVVVASPNMTHVDVLLDVIASGTHVLTEKPLCTTVPDCRRVIDAAARTESIVWVGLEYRYMPSIARLVDDVRSGEIGRLRMLSIREHRFPFLDKVGHWNRFNRNTGGTLVEKCCHFFDLMNLIGAARPTRVFASAGQDVNHLDERYDGEVPDILDNAYVIVDYDNGVRAMLDLCMFAEASKEQGEVVAVGDRGKVEAFTPSAEYRLGHRADGRLGVKVETIHDSRIRHEGLHHGSSYLEHLDFLEAVRTGSAPGVSLDDGLLAVAIGVAAHRSVDERRAVELDEVLAG
ncbi:MAG: Gfo/Idh/MocA family oxidoreductase [Actinomycetota bacterium]